MTKTISEEPSPWRELILVCRKCSAKRSGGFGPDGEQMLRDELKALIRRSGLKGVVRAVETDCLDLCPDHGVSVMRVARPAEILVVPTGTSAESVVERLGLTVFAPASEP
jgi:predicted metal-binding protein